MSVLPALIYKYKNAILKKDLMFGIFIFPTDGKWYAAGHPFKKKPQEALSSEDDAILHISRDHSNTVAYAIHWTDEMDKKTIEECFVYFKEKLPSDININGLKKSKKGYIDENKKYYIRLITNDNKWFKDNLEQ